MPLSLEASRARGRSPRVVEWLSPACVVGACGGTRFNKRHWRWQTVAAVWGLKDTRECDGDEEGEEVVHVCVVAVVVCVVCVCVCGVVLAPNQGSAEVRFGS
jgi:hypothetical protein